MEKNVGGADRAVRWGLGTLLLLAGLKKRGWWNLSSVVGAGLLYTASTQRCGLNKAMGIDTNRSATATAEDESLIDESSEASMIASDAPSWTMGRERRN